MLFKQTASLLWISINGEGGLLTQCHATHICLAHIGIHLHLGQVFGDGKKGWSLKLAATVCPFSIALFKTTPSIGE
jgi:hypothetical protein